MRIAIGSLLLVICLTFAKGQTLPKVPLEDLKGTVVQSEDIFTSKEPVVVSFWATWCAPCIKELATIDENLVDWKEEMNFEFVAISIDDARTVARLRPFVEGRRWTFPVYSDKNGLLQRQMGVAAPPHTFIIYNGEVVWQHTGYAPGDEDELFDKLLELQ